MGIHLFPSQSWYHSTGTGAANITQIGKAGVVGSIPTSSTMFSVTYSGRLIGSCPILSQKSELALRCLPQRTQQSNLAQIRNPTHAVTNERKTYMGNQYQLMNYSSRCAVSSPPVPKIPLSSDAVPVRRGVWPEEF
jgi:hypothetical protein